MSRKQAKSNKERRRFWQMVIETWRDSGMPVSKFCKAEGLSEGTFYNWRKKLSGRRLQPNEHADPSPSAFIEVAMPKSDHAPLELVLSSGHTLRISSTADNKTLSNVISVLRQAGLCIWYKRLEQGSFEKIGNPPKTTSLEIDVTTLSLILEGIDLSNVKQRKRYKRKRYL